jgi:hypothetical protein
VIVIVMSVEKNRSLFDRKDDPEFRQLARGHRPVRNSAVRLRAGTVFMTATVT